MRATEDAQHTRHCCDSSTTQCWPTDSPSAVDTRCRPASRRLGAAWSRAPHRRSTATRRIPCCYACGCAVDWPRSGTRRRLPGGPLYSDVGESELSGIAIAALGVPQQLAVGSELLSAIPGGLIFHPNAGRVRRRRRLLLEHHQNHYCSEQRAEGRPATRALGPGRSGQLGERPSVIILPGRALGTTPQGPTPKPQAPLGLLPPRSDNRACPSPIM